MMRASEGQHIFIYPVDRQTSWITRICAMSSEPPLPLPTPAGQTILPECDLHTTVSKPVTIYELTIKCKLYDNMGNLSTYNQYQNKWVRFWVIIVVDEPNVKPTLDRRLVLSGECIFRGARVAHAFRRQYIGPTVITIGLHHLGRAELLILIIYHLSTKHSYCEWNQWFWFKI